MDRIVMGNDVRIRLKEALPASRRRRGVIAHLLDHLECADLLARQNRFKIVSYLVEVAIAAAHESVMPDGKQKQINPASVDSESGTLPEQKKNRNERMI